MRCFYLMYCLVIVLALSCCKATGPMEKYQPVRVPSIPETAVWAGWIDGGSWIECSFDHEKNANWCTAWDDQVGEVMIRTFFVLRDTGEGVPENELKYSSCSGFHIWLADGRVLEPLRFHGKELEIWDLPPIDPPREVCTGDDCPE